MVDKLKLLLKASSELAKARDLNFILKKLTDVTKKLLDANRCSIFLHDEIKKQLWTVVYEGDEMVRIPDNQGIAGSVFHSGEILNIEDAHNDKRFDADMDNKTGYRTKSVLCIPIKNRENESIGVFQIINKNNGIIFDSQDIEMLNHITLLADSIIENTVLYGKLKRAQQGIIYKLTNATRYKDPETENHNRRVGLYSAILAKYLGWNDSEIETIKLAAPMHDVGKVGIPDRILLKPAKLDPEEWTIMKKHTAYGYNILQGSNSHLLKVAADVSINHHEKWNGKGYPIGKKGEEISLYGRLVAISDVFDALSSNRPYKKAWPLEKTISVIKEERGEHFDPTLVDIFIEHIDEIVKILEEYKDDF